MVLRETLEQNKNSIELALVNFLKNHFKVDGSADENTLKKLGAEIVKKIPFTDYLEVGYALDDYDHTKPEDEKTKKGRMRLLNILTKHKRQIVEYLRKQANHNDKLKSVDDFAYILSNRINDLRESILLSFYPKDVLDESNKPKYHYNAVVPKDIVETIKKWLSEKNIVHYINDNDELVVECGDRDSLYSFDKFLARTVEGQRAMIDSQNMKEAKKRPQDMTSYDLAKMNKPRIDPNKLPKSGAFDKDTKKQLRKTDPMDRRTLKHKGKVYESEEKFILDESVLGMTQMPSILRLQALAGVQNSDSTPPIPPPLVIEDGSESITEAYQAALDHLAVVRELLPEMTMKEYKNLINSIENMINETKL